MVGKQLQQTQTEQDQPTINVLISLHRGYGLGDGVQVSAVLGHVTKYRPRWRVTYQAEAGRECVGNGVVAFAMAYGEPYPCPHYDAEVQICLYDTWSNWGDRPNTRVSSCLHERFGLEWDRECGRYQVNISEKVLLAAQAMLRPIISISPPREQRTTVGSRESSKKRRLVAIHYEGDSSPTKKNLTHLQATAICRSVESFGYVPLLLDWRNNSPLPDTYAVQTVGRFPLSKSWGGNVEMNCAVISQCKAFVGIDSGPSKCASATDTPTLVVWTGHHPAPFHDPAPNTTHLVPVGYHGLEPVCNDYDVIRWFEANYNVRQYVSDPVVEVERWLAEVLR